MVIALRSAKGKRVKIPAHGCGGGDANRGKYAGDGAGQSCLFCLTRYARGVESDYREKHARRGRAPGFFRRPARRRRPLKICLRLFLQKISRRGVPITASGPQGEQPLLYMNNAGKGSRQNRSVTLGKGLALVARGKNSTFASCLRASVKEGLAGAVTRSAACWLAARFRPAWLPCVPCALRSPPAGAKLELQRAKGIRLFN